MTNKIELGYTTNKLIPNKYILVNGDYKCRFKSCAKVFDISLQTLHEIIRMHNGSVVKYNFIAFDNLKDMKAMIERLESIIVISKLVY